MEETSAWVCQFPGQPGSGAVTYLTLGLSETRLHQSSGRPIRQELLFSCYQGAPEQEIVALLEAVAGSILADGHALERGSVLDTEGPLVEGASVESLYCTAPAYFPESLHVFRGVTPPVFFIWLVPLTQGEARCAAEKGWEPFEDLLQATDPDLLDLCREGIELPAA